MKGNFTIKQILQQTIVNITPVLYFKYFKHCTMDAQG